jgi:hypothetical protein
MSVVAVSATAAWLMYLQLYGLSTAIALAETADNAFTVIEWLRWAAGEPDPDPDGVDVIGGFMALWNQWWNKKPPSPTTPPPDWQPPDPNAPMLGGQTEAQWNAMQAANAERLARWREEHQNDQGPVTFLPKKEDEEPTPQSPQPPPSIISARSIPTRTETSTITPTEMMQLVALASLTSAGRIKVVRPPPVLTPKHLLSAAIQAAQKKYKRNN